MPVELEQIKAENDCERSVLDCDLVALGACVRAPKSEAKSGYNFSHPAAHSK